MNPFYKQSVIVLGVVAPLLLVIVLLGVASNYRAKLEATYKQRKVVYAGFRKHEEQREVLEKKVKEQEVHMLRWNKLMSEPSSTTVNDLIGQAQKKFEGKKFVLTSFRRSPSGGIGAVNSQASVKLVLAFRGSFTALQTTFLELETKMPQLQLDSMSLKPSKAGNVLDAYLSYTAWEKDSK